MIRYTKICFAIAALTLIIGGCKKKEYSMGDVTAPTNVVINTVIAGATTANPAGDGSGKVNITLTGDHVLTYQIDLDASDGVKLDPIPTGKMTAAYTAGGINTYRITVVAYGPGGTPTTVTKDISVNFVYDPPAAILTNLTGTGSKTWKIDKDVAGHFGVGPWAVTSTTPEWYAAAPNEKAGCCACFYSASFTFTKLSAGHYQLVVASPDGAFTKTGALAGGLPGIPASGNEGCYNYSGGTSTFDFAPASSKIAATAPSTQVSIKLNGNNTYIGYGAQLKEYEILTISPTNMYLRVQGTETGNAWYLRLKAQ